MTSQTIAVIEGTLIISRPDNVVHYVAKAAIDCDGSDNRHNDPCWQAETSLSHNGKPIDAETVPYIVVPPAIIKGVKPVVLGSMAIVTNTKNGKSTKAVVADVGPRRKIGELSCECARRIGLNGNPNFGGTDEKIIKYEIFVGTPAIVDGVTYKLKPTKA
jgi:hypothetical protein